MGWDGTCHWGWRELGGFEGRLDRIRRIRILAVQEEELGKSSEF